MADNGRLIIDGGQGDPRRRAASHPYAPGEHGVPLEVLEKMNERFENFLPKIVKLDPEYQRSKLLEEDFKKMGARALPHRRGAVPIGIPGATNLGRGTQVSNQLPYMPEFSSPDRQMYPVHRILGNRYWRLFHKMDPVIGNVSDLYSEMPWSNFEFTGEGIDGQIKQHFEDMVDELELLATLPYMVREFLVLGEVIPHLMYSDEKRAWDYLTCHNPDQVEVLDAPLVRMDPILELIPDQRLRAVLSSSDPLVQKVRDQLPEQLVSRLLSRQNIPLSPLNCTFIARKLHPYDIRGTSIISRLWRVLMLEDGIFSATIATARRHAGPLRVAKIGNPQTGWIPGPEHEQRLLELLAQAEVDPLAWIIYHYGVQFEAFGTTDRVISVGREWETLERIKLVGLGVSKAFVSGEITYASSVTGLQVFLQRLLTLRSFFESKWLYPKLLKPISEINGFVAPTQAELSHVVRVRRTAREIEEDGRLLVPKFDWDKKLDANVDRDLIAAMESLERIGFKISKKTKGAAIGLVHEDEMRASLKEEVLEAQERQKYQKELGPAGQGPAGTQPSNTTVQQYQQVTAPQGQPPPKPGIQPPPLPPAATGFQPGTPPGGPAQSAPTQPTAQEAAGGIVRTPMGASPGIREEAKYWKPDEIDDIVGLFRTGASDEAFWTQAATDTFKAAVEHDDYESAWTDMRLYLESCGYPDADVDELRAILASEGILREEAPPNPGLDESLRGMLDSIEDEHSPIFAESRTARRDAFLIGAPVGKSNGVSHAASGGGGRNPFRRR